METPDLQKLPKEQPSPLNTFEISESFTFFLDLLIVAKFGLRIPLFFFLFLWRRAEQGYREIHFLSIDL